MAKALKGHVPLLELWPCAPFLIPINGQSSKRLEIIPNQVHTVFGWDLKVIDLRVYLKTASSYRKFQR